MPMMDMLTGQILMAVVTILWGIFVETWYVGRWTIFFNLVPLFVIMTTQELGDFIWIIVGYTILAIILSQINSPALRQLIGAKSYGTLILALALYSFMGVGTGWAIAAFIGFSVVVYICWGIVYTLKKEDDEIKAWNKQQREAYLKQQRQLFFQQNGYWPNW